MIGTIVKINRSGHDFDTSQMTRDKMELNSKELTIVDKIRVHYKSVSIDAYLSIDKQNKCYVIYPEEIVEKVNRS